MLFGTRLCLQSLVCYTLVPADAEKGLRAKAQALPFGGLVHHTPCGQYLEGKKQVLSDKQKQRLLSGTTIHEVHRLLGTAFRYAVEWGILIKSPVPVDSPKKSTQERSIWDVGEMQAALASMEDPILHLAVHLTLVGALREGEVAGLTPEDINFDAADGMGTFTINKSMQRVQKASLARTGKDCILREFEDKREGSNTVLVLKKTKTASSCRTIFMTEALKEELKHTLKDGPEEILKDAAQTANHKLIEKADEDINLEGMGTTLVAATVIDHTLYFINVGDSRLYLLNKDIRQLSRDHSLVEEMVRLGGINEEEARHHPDKNIITRAIGVKEDVEVDFYEFSLKKGDIILMCSDGLSNMIEDVEIFAIVKGARDIVEAGQNLIDRANENGGNDNISVVLAEPFSDEVSIW